MNISLLTLILAVVITALTAYIITDKTSLGSLKKALRDNVMLEDSNSILWRRLGPVESGAIQSTLKAELGLDAEFDKEGDIVFTHLGNRYVISTDRLPQIAVRKIFNLKDADLDWERLKEAASCATNDIVMVKFGIVEGESLEAYIVAYEQNMSSFKANLFKYLEIIERAVQVHEQYYQERMVGDDEQPDEQLPDAPKILS